MLSYDEFRTLLRTQCMHEAIYDDSEGREILVIRTLDAYTLVRKAIEQTKENQHVNDR